MGTIAESNGIRISTAGKDWKFELPDGRYLWIAPTLAFDAATALADAITASR